MNETKSEMRQKVALVVSTLYRLSGEMPSAEELYAALGSDYASVIPEFLVEVDGLAG